MRRRISQRPPLALLLILATLLLGCCHRPTIHEVPPPGKLVHVGGRKLHLYCTGTGSPTVILMAGGGAFSIDWALVQPKMAQDTRVCSYDRAGLAWSDAGPADETVEQTVSDLHLLLKNAGETPPFLLVGASVGGIYIQAYQRAHAVRENCRQRRGIAYNRLLFGRPGLHRR